MALTIPSFSEDRGPIKVDPATGSTITTPASYCRDLKGCGSADFSHGSISLSINNCTNCVREFQGSFSVSYILNTGHTFADVELMWNTAKTALSAAFKTCP